MLDRNKYVIGDAADHVGLLNYEKISDRRHIHDWSVREHYHEGLLQIFLFGKGVIDAKIDLPLTRIVGPALIWMPALYNHGFNFTQDMKGVVITVPSSDVSRIAKGRQWLSSWMNSPQVLVEGLNNCCLKDIRRLTNHIGAEHRRQGAEKNDALEALLLLLMVSIQRNLLKHADVETGSISRGHEISGRFHDLLDTHFLELRSVADYADLMSVTTTHLSRTVKSITGQTAGEILHARLLGEAKRQLVFTDLTITEISYGLKFSSPSYFTRFFSSRSNLTPIEFRNQKRKKLEFQAAKSTKRWDYILHN